MTAGNTYQITPFVHVRDFDGAVRFFTDILGFTVPYREGNYAYVEREGAAIRILGNDDDEELGRPHRGFAYYIDVKDVGVVLDQIGDNLETLPNGDVLGPIDQPYGQRELIIRAPDGNLLIFGQAIKNST